MDLRKRKTLNSINNAFLELRSRKSLEKIKVTELAALAEISKATFYLHYKDVYDLSEKMQNEIIQNVFNTINHPEYLLTDAAAFTRELFYGFISYHNIIEILFSDNQDSVLPASIEREIRAYIIKEHPEYADDVTLNAYITFQVSGSYHSYRNNFDKFGNQDVIEAVIELVKNNNDWHK